jgi:hypothetical protein
MDTWPYPPENSRLVVTITAPKTIYFPAEPTDGARMAYVDAGSTAALTINGSGRLVQGVPAIEGQGGTRRWFYRADQANWICLEQLQVEDTVPLPPEFDDLFICGLVVRLAPRFKATVDAAITSRYTDMLERAKQRYTAGEKPKSAAEMRSLLRTTP